MRKPKIIFTWKELPYYGARCLAAFARAHPNVTLTVIATRATVPFEGIDDLVGANVIWVDPTNDSPDSAVVRLAKSCDLFISCGWGTPIFNRLADIARKNDSHMVLFLDTNFSYNLKTLLRVAYYRPAVKHKFDSIWVPGASARSLIKLAGARDSKVYDGVYTADETMFKFSPGTSNRTKELLFTGQLIKRKGVFELCKAFQLLSDENKTREYTLLIAGVGPLEKEIKKLSSSCQRIKCLGFVQPRHLADILRRVRFLVLPSREEHWGLVVHEACLSGCIPVLSRHVGSAPDFINNLSNCDIPSVSLNAIAKSLHKLLNMPDDDLDTIATIVHKRAQRFTVDKWCGTLRTLLQKTL